MARVTPSEQNKKEMSTSHWAYAYCPKASWDNRRARMATTANLDPVRTMAAAADQAECRRIDMRPRKCNSLSRPGPPSTSVERWIRQTTPPARRGMAYRQPCRIRHAKPSNSTTIANCIRSAQQPELASHVQNAE